MLLQSTAESVEPGLDQPVIPKIHVQSLPVEIWNIIIKEVCDPMTEAEMLAAVEHFSTRYLRTHGSSHIQERDALSILRVALTCRTFAKVAIPLLFHQLLIYTDTSDSTSLSPTPKISSTLTSPIPPILCSENDSPLYGNFVRFLSVGHDRRMPPIPDFKKILLSCPNVTHLMCFTSSDSFLWWPAISQMTSLVALRMTGLKAPCLDEDSPIVTFPHLESLYLTIVHNNAWGVERWILPKLRSLVLHAGFEVDHRRLERFCQRYGHTVEFLHFDPKCDRLIFASLERLFPRLKHLRISYTSSLYSIDPATVHRGVTVITIPTLSRGDFRPHEPIRPILENLHTLLFPALKQIRCYWTSPLEGSSKVGPWFVEILADWERNGIKFIRINNDELITLDSLTL